MLFKRTAPAAEVANKGLQVEANVVQVVAPATMKLVKAAGAEYHPSAATKAKINQAPQRMVNDTIPAAPEGEQTVYGNHNPRTYRITNNTQGVPEIAAKTRGSSVIGQGKPGIMAKSIASSDQSQPQQSAQSEQQPEQQQSTQKGMTRTLIIKETWN